MRKLKMLFSLTLFFMLSAFTSQAQISIPDADFRNYIVPKADLNSDNQLSQAEAAAYSGVIDLSGLNCSNVIGIEYFTSVNVIFCTGAPNLTALVVSGCSALRYLRCNGNSSLTSVDIAGLNNLMWVVISNNPVANLNLTGTTGMTSLYLESNLLTTLDVSSCTSLERLTLRNGVFSTVKTGPLTNLESVECTGNQVPAILNLGGSSVELIFGHNSNIQTMNLSNCTRLRQLYCPNSNMKSLSLSSCYALELVQLNDNDLTTLRVRNGNNTAISYFNIVNNPNLTCVEVDNPSYSTGRWTLKDAGASYALGCNLVSTGGGLGNPLGGGPVGPKVVGGNTNNTAGTTYDVTGFSSVEGGINAQVFPNPTNGTVTVDLGTAYKNAVVEVTNAVGQTVYNKTFTNAQRAELNLDGAAGMYMVTVRTEAGNQTFKVVKQ